MTTDKEHLDNFVDFARNKSPLLTEFVDWLTEEGIRLCTWVEPQHEEDDEEGHTPGLLVAMEHLARERPQWWPINERWEQLFARFAGVDLAAVERARAAVLEELQDANRNRTIAQSLCEFEADVLVRRADGFVEEWGAAVGQAMELFQSRGLLNPDGSVTPRGHAVAKQLKLLSKEEAK